MMIPYGYSITQYGRIETAIKCLLNIAHERGIVCVFDSIFIISQLFEHFFSKIYKLKFLYPMDRFLKLSKNLIDIKKYQE